MSTMRTLVVDDQPITLAGVMAWLCPLTSYVPIAAGSFDDAKKAAGTDQAQLAVVRLSPFRIFELIQWLHGQGVKVLVWGNDEFLNAERCLRLGAAGFIDSADFTKSRFSEALEQLSRGEVVLSDRMGTRLLQIVVGGRDHLGQNPVETLTNRQIEVFEMLALGLSSREIAARLQVKAKTITNYCQHIRRKLSIDSQEELIAHAQQWFSRY